MVPFYTLGSRTCFSPEICRAQSVHLRTLRHLCALSLPWDSCPLLCAAPDCDLLCSLRNVATWSQLLVASDAPNDSVVCDLCQLIFPAPDMLVHHYRNISSFSLYLETTPHVHLAVSSARHCAIGHLALRPLRAAKYVSYLHPGRASFGAPFEVSITSPISEQWPHQCPDRVRVRWIMLVYGLYLLFEAARPAVLQIRRCPPLCSLFQSSRLRELFCTYSPIAALRQTWSYCDMSPGLIARQLSDG